MNGCHLCPKSQACFRIDFYSKLKFIFATFRIDVPIETVTLQNGASVIRPQKVKWNKREIEQHPHSIAQIFHRDFAIYLSIGWHTFIDNVSQENRCEEPNKCTNVIICSMANLVRLKKFASGKCGCHATQNVNGILLSNIW